MSGKEIVKTLILVALPASGKSELRKFMEKIDADGMRDLFHMGPTVQLDDFPYVHMMRRIDEELNKLGQEGIFFWDPERPFRNPVDWGTLIHLLNKDYAHLVTGEPPVIEGGKFGRHFLRCLEQARVNAGGPAFLNDLDNGIFDIVNRIDSEAQRLVEERSSLRDRYAPDKTVVIEFSRGGSDEALMPIPAPMGYQYSFSQLSNAILESAAVLYIEVDPEQARRKNRERTDAGDPGSILHHGVPEEVMHHDYGCDDIRYLVERSGKPNRLRVVARGKVYLLPAGVFNNRVDKTTFLRSDPKGWSLENIQRVTEELKNAMDAIVA